MTTERSGTGLALARAVRAPPLADERLWQAEPVELARDGMVHDVVDVLWSSVKGRPRRQDHRAHLREPDHALEVAEEQRRLTHEQDQRAAIPERHVRSPRDERGAATRGDRPAHLHRTS